MLNFLRTFFEQPELVAPAELRPPTLTNRGRQHVSARIHKAIKARCFHERHATRQRRLVAELIREAGE
jgi:hypothetical protein